MGNSTARPSYVSHKQTGARHTREIKHQVYRQGSFQGRKNANEKTAFTFSEGEQKPIGGHVKGFLPVFLVISPNCTGFNAKKES